MSPDFDFFKLFVEGLSNFEIVVTVIGFVSAAAFAVLLSSKFGSWVLPQPRESRVSDFLPFAELMEDGMTIRCTNGSYARVFRITGMDLGSATPESAIIIMGVMTAQLLNTIQSGDTP